MANLGRWWADFRDSLWFLPSVLTTAAILLAVATLALDQTGLASRAADRAPVLLGAGAEGARGVLGATAGGLITVTGVIFSVTIVALQLASTQFTPRVLRNFTSDRGNQPTLGVLIGAFTYTLLVMRAIRGADAGGPFVPTISITVAVGLALVGVGFLVYFIGHLARSLQAPVIIQRVTDDTLAAVDRAYVRPDDAAASPLPRGVAVARDTVRADDAGYVQTVDADALVGCAAQTETMIRMEVSHGEFVLPGDPLVSASPAGRLRSGDHDRLRAAVVLGRRRTVHDDPTWGVVELADIAVRALSPGVNDPTTASLCIDRLAQLLSEIGRREPRRRLAPAHDGGAVALRPVPFARTVEAAFDRIGHHGADDTTVVQRVMDALGAVAPRVRPHHRPALAAQIELLLERAEPAAGSDADRRAIRAAASTALGRARSRSPGLVPLLNGRAARASSPSAPREVDGPAR